MLTDNPVLSEVEGGIQFTNMTHHKYISHYIFDRVCDEYDIEHRPTKIEHPWINAYKHGRRLKTLSSL